MTIAIVVVRAIAGVRWALCVYRLEEQGAEHHHQKLHRKERHRKQIQMLRCGDHAESGKVSVISVRFRIIIERDF